MKPRATIKVTTAWIWIASWVMFDIVFYAAGWSDADHFKHKILEDSAIAFFLLGLWLFSGFGREPNA